MTDRDAEILDFMQRESHRYDKNARTTMTALNGLGSVAVGLLVAASSVAATSGAQEVLFALPLLGIVLWILAIRLSLEMFAMFAHKHWLETRQVEVLKRLGPGRYFVAWGDAGGSLMIRSIANIAAYTSFAILELAVAAVSYAVLFDSFHHLRWLLWLDMSFYALGLIVIAKSAGESLAVYGKTLALLDGQSPLGDSVLQQELNLKNHD